MALVTAGPYRYSRNPIYIGFLLIYLGFTLLAGTLWGLLLSPFLIGTVTQWIIHSEESLSQKEVQRRVRVVHLARAPLDMKNFAM